MLSPGRCPRAYSQLAADFRGGGNIPLLVERGNQSLTLALTVAPTP